MDPLELKNILVIRTDRIGDVVLSTPVLSALKARFPQSRVTMMVRPYTKEIVEGHPDLDHILLYEKNQLQGKAGRQSLIRHIREQRFDAAIIVHPTFKLAKMIYFSGIPIRLGTGFRWYSFLFNRRVFEHRKKAQFHELEYNLRLLNKIDVPYPEKIEFKFFIPENAFNKALSWLHSNNIFPKKQKIALVHPGSGGSALDWPPEKFSQLCDKLNQMPGVKVILTGGPNEQDIVEEVYRGTQSKPLRAVGIFSIKELAALIKMSHLFVANSTGPLHIAVAVGTEVIGFYCPLVPCLPERWGPYGRRHDSVLMPAMESCKKCNRQKCEYKNCMELISVEQAIEMVEKKLKVEA